MPNDCGYCGEDCDQCCSSCCESNSYDDGYGGCGDIWKSKKPKTRARHVGIEIEFTSPMRPKDLGELLTREGFEDTVCLKDDGSIDADDGYGHEIAFLTTEKMFSRDIQKLCDVLNDKAEADVNSSCGLHVHLDMRNRDPKKAFANLAKVQDMLFAMQPRSRRRSTYCRFSPDTWEKTMRENDRYMAINPHSYERFKTIEVRLHAGTTNAKKITNWVELLLRIVRKRGTIKEVHATLSSLSKEVKLRGKLKQYVAERLKAFEGVTEDARQRGGLFS